MNKAFSALMVIVALSSSLALACDEAALSAAQNTVDLALKQGEASLDAKLAVKHMVDMQYCAGKMSKVVYCANAKLKQNEIVAIATNKAELGLGNIETLIAQLNETQRLKKLCK